MLVVAIISAKTFKNSATRFYLKPYALLNYNFKSLLHQSKKKKKKFSVCLAMSFCLPLSHFCPFTSAPFLTSFLTSTTRCLTTETWSYFLGYHLFFTETLPPHMWKKVLPLYSCSLLPKQNLPQCVLSSSLFNTWQENCYGDCNLVIPKPLCSDILNSLDLC